MVSKAHRACIQSLDSVKSAATAEDYNMQPSVLGAKRTVIVSERYWTAVHINEFDTLRHHKGMHVCQQQNMTPQKNVLLYGLQSSCCKILSFTCSLLSLKKRIGVGLSYYQGSDSLNNQGDCLPFGYLCCTCTQGSVTKLNVYLFHSMNIWGQYCLRCR